MRRHSRVLAQAAVAAVALVPALSTSVSAQSTTWVKGGTTGRLLYGMDDSGDRINDFSRSGYKGADAPLPVTTSLGLPVINVSPVTSGAGDSLAAIQAAINAAAARPLQANGYRAVVQLAPGTFKVSGGLTMTNASGVILRGAGSGTSTTTSTQIAYTGTDQIQMITVDSSASRQIVSGTTKTVTAKVVPAGSYALPMSSLSGYSVGDKILVQRPSPLNWLQDIGMRDLDNPWGPGNYDQDYERVITAIDVKNKSIMLDTPIPNAIQAKYGGAKVSKYTFDRAANIGIENIRGDGQFGAVTPSTDENHANSFIQVRAAENVFVRNIAAIHQVYSAVDVEGQGKHVTVDGASFASAVSQVTGERRYSFNEEGQYTLMQNLTSDRSRHDFINNSPSRGPNVFFNALATNSNDDSGPHQRWSTGTLYDNVEVQGGNGLNIRNRGNSGSGHGWTGSGMVVWNSTATAGFNVESPPTSQNWIIGSTGSYDASSNPSYAASKNAPVTLNVDGQTYTSLYQAQLTDRQSRVGETTREYTVGDYDGYETGDAADTPYVDPAWLALAAARRTDFSLQGLDTRVTDAKVPFTFEFDLNPAVEHVTSAVLTLALNATAANATSGSQIFVDTTDASKRFSDLGGLTRFTTDTGVTSDLATIEFTDDDPVFNLAKLQDGQLNVLLYQRYAVDWADLVITVAPGAAVPEPTSLAFLLSGATLLMRRRRR